MKQKELLEKVKKTENLNEIQTYIKEVIRARGFENQPVEQTFLLLTEEVGELAKAIRKEKTTMCIDKNKIKNYDSVESEVADVFIVLTSICNTLHINLYKAILEKETENVTRNWENEK